PSFNGQVGFGAPPPQFGAPPPQYGAAAAPQSQIETALSLPRPDPAALWLAQQEKQRGDRKNTGVLIAVVALTALCVLGIGALIYFKLRARAQSTVVPDGATAIAA